jgi:hypothetical protein
MNRREEAIARTSKALKAAIERSRRNREEAGIKNATIHLSSAMAEAFRGFKKTDITESSDG